MPDELKHSEVDEQNDSPGVQLAPEMLVQRLGEYLINIGHLEEHELKQALEYQRVKKAAGEDILLGQSLITLGFINQEVLDRAVTEQIMALHDALQESNRKLERRVKERTAELHGALSKLSELNELKTNIVSNISHELRTPMTHIIGYLELLISGDLGKTTKKQSEALVIIERAAQSLHNLIESLVDFSQISKGELSLDLGPTKINKLVQQATESLEKKAQAKQISIITSVPQDLPMINLDSEKILWVLQQLMDNAVKFSQPGDRVQVNVNHDYGLVTFAVIDNGIGISPRRQAEIFESFHQLDGSSTRQYSGTGLGLALAQRIVELHGSRIRVQSQEGQGSYFAFSLPVMDGNNG